MNESVPAWYTRPVWLGVIGLGLLVASWKLSTLDPHDSGMYRRASQVIFATGLLLFCAAGVLMYLQPATPPVDDHGDLDKGKDLEE